MTVEPQIVEHRLRETLQERAARVSPSPDGWTSITLKIDHRRQQARVVVFAFAALLPVVAVGATLAAVRDGNDARPIDTAGPALTPSTPETTVPAAAVGPTVTTAMRGTTTVPRNLVPPAAAATTVAGTARIWPETKSELDEFQKGFDEGHAAWRGSPDGVARVFLLGRALPDPKVEPTDHGASQVAVPYTAGGVGGTVHLARDREAGVYYVTANTTERITRVDVSREDNGLALEIQSPTTGTVSARTKKPGGSWSTYNSQPISSGGSSRVLVGVGQSGDLILQVRHEGDDGKVGITDQYVAAKAAVTPPGGAALGKGSKLDVDRIGPVKVGMTLGEAEGAAGVQMTRRDGAYCTELTPDGGPAGLAFVATAGSGRVDVITVAEPGVTTLGGIGVGSTLAEVDKAYPSAERRLTHDEGRLVYRADDPALAEFELVIGIGEGKVTQLWAGHKGLGTTDEICA